MRRPCPGLNLRLRLALRLEDCVEVDRIQQYWREAGAHDRVGDDLAQVGIENVGAGDAENRLEFLRWHIAYLEHAALARLDEKNSFFSELGRDRHAHQHFEITLVN